LLNKNETPPSVGKIIRGRLEDAFDVNYNVSEINISSVDAFRKMLLQPYEDGQKVYYRGERTASDERRLVPALLREGGGFFSSGADAVTEINSRRLFDFYCSRNRFISVYKTLYGDPDPDNMYIMTAFAQHYLDISPFIDFTKCPYVALSFALKGRKKADDDIVIYTALDIGDDDTTSSIEEVNEWLSNYDVKLINTSSSDELLRYFAEKGRDIKIKPSFSLRDELRQLETVFGSVFPTAKLIDIPTNDLMKYQQGVFLLLNGFNIVDSNYLTKSVRQSFVINKYIISSGLCGELDEILTNQAPQYRYEFLMDIAKAVRE